MDVQARKKIVVENKRCYICLGSHLQSACTKPDAKCGVRNCNGRHHTLIHYEQTEFSRAMVNAPDVLLRIIPVSVVGERGRSASTFAMLDGGSTCSLMDEDFANKVGLRGSPTTIQLNTIAGDGNHSVRITSCAIRSTKPPYDEISIKKIHIKRGLPLPDNQSRKAINLQKWRHLQDLRLNEKVDHPHVSLLIGEDVPEILRFCRADTVQIGLTNHTPRGLD